MVLVSQSVIKCTKLTDIDVQMAVNSNLQY